MCKRVATRGTLWLMGRSMHQERRVRVTAGRARHGGNWTSWSGRTVGEISQREVAGASAFDARRCAVLACGCHREPARLGTTGSAVSGAVGRPKTACAWVNACLWIYVRMTASLMLHLAECATLGGHRWATQVGGASSALYRSASDASSGHVLVETLGNEGHLHNGTGTVYGALGDSAARVEIDIPFYYRCMSMSG